MLLGAVWCTISGSQEKGHVCGASRKSLYLAMVSFRPGHIPLFPFPFVSLLFSLLWHVRFNRILTEHTRTRTMSSSCTHTHTNVFHSVFLPHRELLLILCVPSVFRANICGVVVIVRTIYNIQTGYMGFYDDEKSNTHSEHPITRMSSQVNFVRLSCVCRVHLEQNPRRFVLDAGRAKAKRLRLD